MSDYAAAREKLKSMWARGERGDELTEPIDTILEEAYILLDETRNIPPSLRASRDTSASSNQALLIAKELATILNLPLNWPRIALEAAACRDSVTLWQKVREVLDKIEELCQRAGYISLEKRMARR
jgi:hypothetical protein